MISRSHMTADTAKRYLEWAGSLNPGRWIDHSRGVARAAGIIAGKCGFDAERAFALGLVHDIGRYRENTGLRHVCDGYLLMLDAGHEEAAAICLTHSFPLAVLESYVGVDDCDDEERALLRKGLEKAAFNDYVRLIQLCDSLVLPEGLCLMEKRIVDVAMRHGVNSHSVENWRQLFELRDYFSRLAGCAIYDLFPEAAAITFAE